MAVGPGDRIGNYVIEELLGDGGQGTVFRARHERLGRRVALKVPRAEVAARLLREAQLIASLDHRGVVRVEHVEAAADPPYLVMELCEGGDLDQLLAQQPGGLDEDRVAEVARALLDALAYVHEQGVVHRDVKPGNVVFDAAGAPKLCDLGAGVAEPGALDHTVDRTRLGGVGTPAYMAPEQRDSRPVDGRADLFALGKVIYRMLTGRRPDTVRPVQRDRPGVRASWDDLIFALTEEDPARRPADARAAREKLDEVLRTKAFAEGDSGVDILASGKGPAFAGPAAPAATGPAGRASGAVSRRDVAARLSFAAVQLVIAGGLLLWGWLSAGGSWEGRLLIRAVGWGLVIALPGTLALLDAVPGRGRAQAGRYVQAFFGVLLLSLGLSLTLGLARLGVGAHALGLRWPTLALFAFLPVLVGSSLAGRAVRSVRADRLDEATAELRTWLRLPAQLGFLLAACWITGIWVGIRSSEDTPAFVGAMLTSALAWRAGAPEMRLHSATWPRTAALLALGVAVLLGLGWLELQEAIRFGFPAARLTAGLGFLVAGGLGVFVLPRRPRPKAEV